MIQSSDPSSSEPAPADRAFRLASRLKGKCLRSGGTGAALQETGVLDSGSLAALSRLSADLLDLQERDPLPADPLRQLTGANVPGRNAGRLWTLRRTRAAETRVPLLNSAQWQSWQHEVKQTGERLTRQWSRLDTLQARQELLLNDLQTDARILTRAAETLLADPELPGLWRDELARGLSERALDIGSALEVARQLGGAVRLMRSNHTLMQGRLLAASRLLLYASQTGLSLQQALDAQGRVETLPEFRPVLLPPPAVPDRHSPAFPQVPPTAGLRKDQE